MKGEYIFRLHEECFFNPSPPAAKTREPYPWEKRYVGGYPCITKEFFRCKGNPAHPVVIQTRENRESLYFRDCLGGLRHSLPLIENEECIYPCLLEILNYIQQKTEKKVVITCGHRCPEHNMYADYSPQNWGSKHMIGAEVDFYVKGMENNMLEILELIKNYYLETEPFCRDSDYTIFQRFQKAKLNVSTPPWFNKEIFVKFYKEDEGRDFDNSHPYPYLGIQVRYDRNRGNRVIFDPAQAQNYLRY